MTCSLTVLYLGLSNLVELTLTNNFLTEVPVTALANLNNIKMLDLGSNRIQVNNNYNEN